ncbi:hypothetical protein ACWGH8_09935 [Nonomuraea muscovyensis]|uniref:Uncharacterized protein n=1 Tax=Nonomuraea muscovyensis TaxID=1124761 RepID=A0A7X0EVE4_9ACTN|nr:hypothetical protein [Nonomuraea muscovyensis]MBB6345767.1 hypothetical protein [Nonomuraea muscovyensis]
MSPRTVCMLRLCAVLAAAAPVLTVLVPREVSFGWFADAPLPETSWPWRAAREVHLWGGILLPAALALVVLWRPARLRAAGLPLTLPVLLAGVLVALGDPLPPFTTRTAGLTIAALAVTSVLLGALLLAARPAPGPPRLPPPDDAPRAALAWTAALGATLWPLLHHGLAPVPPSPACDPLMPAPLHQASMTDALGLPLVAVACAATVAATAGTLATRLTALATAVLLGLAALAGAGEGACFAPSAGWPYLLAAALTLLACLPRASRAA